MTEQNKTTTIPLPVQGKDMDSIMQSLESGVEELFTSNRYQEFLKTMAKFHNYSFNNTMLIAMQRPDATLVTSYKNWQSMGRQVMKGEKGITIIAPAPYKKMKEKEVLDENQRPIMGTDGKPKTEQVEVTVPHFKAVTVFDIAQTSGEPIQTLAPELLTAAVQDFDSFMQAIQKISTVPIRFDEIDGNANGYYHNADKEIVIKKGLSESQTLKTAIHETAHAKLHDKEIMESLGVEKDRLTKEVEAESVAVFDVMLPGMDGISAVKKIRTMPKVSDLPVMILTAKDSEVDKVQGLEGGADDYMTKPFSVLELCARVRALIRRSKMQANASKQIIMSGIVINQETRDVYCNGELLELTYKEYELLLLLMINHNQVLEREELLNKIWGYGGSADTRTIDVHIRHLREKLKDQGECIKTIRGVGYRFIDLDQDEKGYI